MKLINPTDEQLNEAFAEKVAGWKLLAATLPEHRRVWVSPDSTDGQPDVVELTDGHTICRPLGAGAPDFFTTSVDAVLPWLEKCWFFKVMKNTPRLPTTAIYAVEIAILDDSHPDGQRRYYSEDMTLPRAAVIALLRAHGVEVEFSQCPSS